MPVIAQLRGLLTQLRVSVTAWLTQSAGPALPEHTTRGGNSIFVEPTSQPNQPAPTQPSPKKERVRKTTLASKSGKESLIAHPQQDKALTLDGSKSKTPARRTRQPAKPVAKAAPKRAKRTTAAKSSK